MDLKRAGFSLIAGSRLHKATGRPCLGRGVILYAHRVQPARADAFQPNRFLTITPEFLQAVVGRVRALGFETVSLDEAHARLGEDDARAAQRPPFVTFTFDDGYRDNRIWAHPVLAAAKVPYTIYVPTRFADGTGVLWWELIERVVAAHDTVTLPDRTLAARTAAEKVTAYAAATAWLASLPPALAHAEITQVCARHGIDAGGLCRELIMGWDELADFARGADGLLTVGGHTVNHYRLSRLSPADAAAELADNIATLGGRLGERPRHFSYPFGDRGSAGPREFDIARGLGLSTAVTTFGSVVHADADPMALHRLCLNRVYEDLDILEVMMSGVPEALRRRLRRSA